MTKTQKVYDLEERTFLFARDVRRFCKAIPKNVTTLEYIKQVIRSSGSVGANYIEANESLGRKDFFMRLRIARKEAKETVYWLRLLQDEVPNVTELSSLIKEGGEIKKILSAIIERNT